MAGRSLSHRLARHLVRPLLGTAVTPNHLTSLRLVAALGAAAAFALGRYPWDAIGGILWTLAVFLDYADGELARLSGRASAAGQRWDFVADVLANALVFIGLGVGLATGWLGTSALSLGLVAAVSVAAAAILVELIERRTGGAGKAYAGFDLDALTYLYGPAAWAGLLPYLLLGASLGAPAFALHAWWRWRREGRLAP